MVINVARTKTAHAPFKTAKFYTINFYIFEYVSKLVVSAFCQCTTLSAARKKKHLFSLSTHCIFLIFHGVNAIFMNHQTEPFMNSLWTKIIRCKIFAEVKHELNNSLARYLKL